MKKENEEILTQEESDALFYDCEKDDDPFLLDFEKRVDPVNP